MIFRIALMTTLFIGSIAIASPAWAGDNNWRNAWGAGNWVGHHLLAVKDWAHNLGDGQKLEAHRYLNYEHREPCQNYRQLSEELERLDCHRGHKASKTTDKDDTLGQVFRTYTVYFDFDSADLTNEATKTLRTVSQEISRFSPDQVTVAGHADSSGPADYNRALSQRRAEAVSEALTNRGVENRIIRRTAFGENKLAVRTLDGVREQKNRRVVVEFRR